MKVLHIINSLNYGGAEKLIVDSLPHYSKLGVSVDLFLLDGSDTKFSELLQKSFKGQIFKSTIKNVYSPLNLFELKKVLGQPYDIVHVHLFPSLYWAALAKLLFNRKINLVFTEHNTANRRLSNFLFRQIDKIIYRQYIKITAITPEVKNVLHSKLNIANHKIKVIYNGIDIEKFQNSIPYSKDDFFSGEDIVILQVSRFEKQKDQKTLIRSLMYLPDRYKLLLVGNGSLIEESQKLAEQLHLAKRVKFLGIRMDVGAIMKTASIIVQSSNWEGFGLSAVEGMASRKPLVASNVAGLSDIVRDAGLLFTPGNEKELAEHIFHLGENKDFAEQVAAKCEEKSRNYSIEKMVKEIVMLYKML